jgi:hypothetical protein
MTSRSASSSSIAGLVALSTLAISRSSSASSSCLISRSIFSDDLPKAYFFSFAIRSVWISWSCARSVAAILAFSACQAAIIAFRAEGSSGRMGVSIDMSSPTTPDHEAP